MPKQKQQEHRRQRRSLDQQISALQEKILALREREARKQAKADPAVRHAKSAVKAIDKALGLTADAGLKRSLAEARSYIASCLGMDGAVIVPTRARRSAARTSEFSEAILAYVRSNPGQRGEQIASALGTDSTTMRPAMKRLIVAGMVSTEGARRGMTYAAVSELLAARPDLKALTLSVVLWSMAIGPVYSVDEALGSVPFVV